MNSATLHMLFSNNPIRIFRHNRLQGGLQYLTPAQRPLGPEATAPRVQDRGGATCAQIARAHATCSSHVRVCSAPTSAAQDSDAGALDAGPRGNCAESSESGRRHARAPLKAHA